jgi:hypothetical protein
VASPHRPAAAAEPSNRRTDDRRGAKLPVQIRSATGEDELSSTENLSPGGLAVSLAMDLRVGDKVEVIHSSAAASELTARNATVRRRSAYPLGGRRLYGLQFAG